MTKKALITGVTGNGTMRKVMDVSRPKAWGWKPRVALRDGLARAYQDMLSKT